MNPSTPSDLIQRLLDQNTLTPQQGEIARRKSERDGIPQHHAIIDLAYASEQETYQALAHLNHLEFVALSPETISPPQLDQFPSKLLFHYRLVPIQHDDSGWTLALSEPLNSIDEDNLRLVLGQPFKIVLSTPSSIQSILKSHFGLGAATIQKLRQDHALFKPNDELVFEVKDLSTRDESDPSIARFVDQILMEALRLNATDIHFEPYANSIKLRYRIDGLMHTIPLPSDLHPLRAAIVSRFKIMAGLNIAERRLPQDGRIAMTTQGEEYDLRVSLVPTNYGEAICLRILGRKKLFLDLSQLGMELDQETIFSQLTLLPHGLVLITGPTGSGKTTTLYAALAHANDDVRKIITLEDPVEYQLNGITQIQTREDIGLSFATGLRSVLRHDPDIVLVGEIRDSPTAEIALRAAQTGHLVFSTLHANDSISAITRLIDMRIESSLLGSSLQCAIAQRLPRILCRRCLAPAPHIAPSLLQEMSLALRLPISSLKPYTAEGCEECYQTGYRGRSGIYEFFIPSDPIKDQISSGITTHHLRLAAIELGWTSLRQNAWKKVQNKTTSIEEVERLTHRIQSLTPPQNPPKP